MKGLRRRIHELSAHDRARAHRAGARGRGDLSSAAVVGCTPLFGLHIVVCIALAWALGLNKLIVYGAANLSIPPLVPFIGFASVQLGERILHGAGCRCIAATSRSPTCASIAKSFFVDWMVGGVVLGAAIGLVAGWHHLASSSPDVARAAPRRRSAPPSRSRAVATTGCTRASSGTRA